VTVKVKVKVKVASRSNISVSYCSGGGMHVDALASKYLSSSYLIYRALIIICLHCLDSSSLQMLEASRDYQLNQVQLENGRQMVMYVCVYACVCLCDVITFNYVCNTVSCLCRYFLFKETFFLVLDPVGEKHNVR